MEPVSFRLISESSLRDLHRKLDQILQCLDDRPGAGGNLGKWVPEKEAQALTGKKATALWQLRVRGLLSYTKINNRVFYDRDSILALLESNKVQAFRR